MSFQSLFLLSFFQNFKEWQAVLIFFSRDFQTATLLKAQIPASFAAKWGHQSSDQQVNKSCMQLSGFSLEGEDVPSPHVVPGPSMWWRATLDYAENGVFLNTGKPDRRNQGALYHGATISALDCLHEREKNFLFKLLYLVRTKTQCCVLTNTHRNFKFIINIK